MMPMTVRPFDFDRDMVMLKEWADAVSAHCPPREILPQVGCVVETHPKHGGKSEPVATGFLYLSVDCPVGVIEWVFFSPQATPRKKREAAIHVISCLTECSIDEHRPVVFASSNSSGLTRLYEDIGYLKANENMSHLIFAKGE